jgi:hypothetical protein
MTDFEIEETYLKELKEIKFCGLEKVFSSY